MVVGAREGKNYSESIKKGALRFILKYLVEFTAGRRIPDINSGLRVFSRSAVMQYFPHLCDTFSFTTSLTLAYFDRPRIAIIGNQVSVQASPATIGVSYESDLLRDSIRSIPAPTQSASSSVAFQFARGLICGPSPAW